MSEDEAKTKWCPASRVNGTGTPSDDVVLTSNRPTHDAYNCIGSACMAWRWSDGDQEMVAVYIPKADLKGSPALHAPGKEWAYVGPHHNNSTYLDDNHYWFKRPWVPGARGGYCGLAGQPQ